MSAIEKYSGLHSSKINPVVHYGWCKYRAYEELKIGNIDTALNNFSSDMMKNTQTADALKPMMNFIFFAKDNCYECFKFISGFAIDGPEESLSAAEKTSLKALMQDEGELREKCYNQLLKDAKEQLEENNLEKEPLEKANKGAPEKFSSKTEKLFKGIFK